jgi:hypothetical protein
MAKVLSLNRGHGLFACEALGVAALSAFFLSDLTNLLACVTKEMPRRHPLTGRGSVKDSSVAVGLGIPGPELARRRGSTGRSNGSGGQLGRGTLP